MAWNPNESALAGVSTETLQAWLATAQQALADLSTGGKVASVIYSQGPAHREVTYTRAEMGQLMAWIKTLQAQLGIVQHSRRAIGVSF